MEEMCESEVVVFYFFLKAALLSLALPLSRFIIIVCASLCVLSTLHEQKTQKTRARAGTHKKLALAI